MAVPDNDERRKHSRVSFATDIKIFFESGGKKISLEGDSRDLSLKGIFVTTPDASAVGTACEIKILLTGGIDKIELKIKGRVARVTPSGMGIVFDSMDVDSYSHLKNIVRYNSIDDSTSK